MVSAVPLTTQQTADGRIVVETKENVDAADLLSLAESWQQRLFTLWGGHSSPQTRLLVRLAKASRDQAQPPIELTAWQDGAKLNLQITVTSRAVAEGDEFLRALTRAILYQIIYRGGLAQNAPDHLPALPLWLVEGSLQSCLEGRAEWAKPIVQRARFLRKTPSLETVLSWKALARDSLERAWQQAFCLEVIQFSQINQDRWQALQEWLLLTASSATIAATPWTVDEAQQTAWEEGQEDSRFHRAPLIYSWGRTAAELAVAQTVSFPAASEKSPEVLTTLPQLLAQRTHPAFRGTLQTKVAQLATLEMRAHFSWRPVIELYRDATLSLLNPKTTGAQYAAKIERAEAQAARLTNFAQRVEDYLNWFEVTSPGPLRFSEFAGVFAVNEELAAFSNKIRAQSEADLIKVEKRL